jgi:multiple sugar transport system substrate-binding protein
MGRRLRASLALVGAIVIAFALSGCGESDTSKGPTTIKWYVFKEPGGAFDGAAASCSKDSGGRYKISVVALPTDSDQQRELIVRRLAAKDSDLDVIGMDVNWTAEFAEAEWIVPWDGPHQQSAEQGVIPALLAPAKYKGKTWVAPYTTNTQLLWYDKTVVKTPPKTWDEMIAMAQQIKPPKNAIVVQGRRYEGMVVWFNTLVASAGGEIVNRDGDTVLGPPAVKAAQIMHDVATKAGTPSIANEKEDTGKDTFKAGQAAFMVNYPFVYASIAEDKKALANLGYARYPSVKPGEPSHVTFGGINLGVSKYAKNKDLAFQAAQCLAAPEQQKVAAIKGGLFPTRQALFDDPEIRKAYPFADLVQETLNDGVPRPVLPAYSDISLAIQSKLHPPGDVDPQSAIDDLGGALEKAKEGKLF